MLFRSVSSYLIISHHISSYLIISHHISSYLISSYLIISHHISSYLISYHLTARTACYNRGHVTAFLRPKGSPRALHQGNVMFRIRERKAADERNFLGSPFLILSSFSFYLILSCHVMSCYVMLFQPSFSFYLDLSCYVISFMSYNIISNQNTLFRNSGSLKSLDTMG